MLNTSRANNNHLVIVISQGIAVMQTIEIDSDVFNAISALQLSEKFTLNIVLSKLLCLIKTESIKFESWLPWVTECMAFSHGALFRCRYKGHMPMAKVDNGSLVLKGRRFLSLSEAVYSITRKYVPDTWLFWEYRLSEYTAWKSAFKLKTACN